MKKKPHSEIKIISGGQNGADLGGLLAAEALGSIRTGGFMPLGFKTEDGNFPEYAERFGMVALESSNYALRTIKNVKESDVTLVFAYDVYSYGTQLTIAQCKKQGKPVLVTWLGDYSSDVHDDKIIEFLNKHQPKIINVAGNRESKHPGICKMTYDIMRCVLKKWICNE